MSPRADTDHSIIYTTPDEYDSDDDDSDDDVCVWCGDEYTGVVFDWNGMPHNTCDDCLVEVAEFCTCCELFKTAECFVESETDCSTCREDEALDAEV